VILGLDLKAIIFNPCLWH